MSIRVTDNCKNVLESYNAICVYCNKCYRFSEDVEERKKEREEETLKIINWIKENMKCDI